MKAREDTRGRVSLLESRPSTPESRAKALFVMGLFSGFVGGVGVGIIGLGVFTVGAVLGTTPEMGWDDVGLLFGVAAVFLVTSFYITKIVVRELQARNYDLSKEYVEAASDGSA